MSLPTSIVVAAVILAVGFIVGKLIEVWGRSRAERLPRPLTKLPAPVIPSDSAQQVSEHTELWVGVKVIAKQRNSWYRAKVLRLVESGEVEVDYIGWNEREVVSRDNLLIDENAKPIW